MSSRKRMTVFTPPTTLQVPTLVTTASLTGKPPVRYRVEERTRTVFVTSEVPPSQWDSRNLGSLFSQTDSGDQPMRRTRPKVQTEYVITEETPDSASSGPHSAPAILSSQRSRRSSSSSARRSAPPSPRRSPQPSPRRSPQPSPIPPSPTSRPFRGPRTRILFYHKQDPYYGFTNFSPHPVKYKGKVYPTSEHLFQSFKFQGCRDDIAEHIRLYSPFPSVAFSEARRFPSHVRPDWRKVNISKMDEALYHKFTQHNELRAELLATRDAELVEDSDKDSFWGIGADGKGSNELGKALERLRTRLRKEGW